MSGVVLLTAAELMALIRKAVREEMAAGNVGAADVLTRNEAAELLRIHPMMIPRHVKRDGLPGIKVGNEWRFYRADVLEWLESRKVAV